MRALTALFLLTLTAGLAAQGIQIGQGRDMAPRPVPVGSGVISGTVMTDDASPQPLRRARVSVSSNDGAIARTVLTDDAGRYSLIGMPASRYIVAAVKPGYVRMTYGAKSADRPGTQVTLADGQKVTNIDMKLGRGGVITGRILDEHGQPAFGVNVRVLQYRTVNGERTLVGAGGMGAVANDVTDDRGAYRLYGLAAGEYVVTASPRNIISGEIRAMTSAEIRAAIQAAQQPQSAPATGTTPGTATPAAPREYPTVGYAPVYYPGTTFAGSAASVVIAAGEERSSIDFQLQLVRTARIEGTVIVPDGIPPQSVQLVITPTGPNNVPGALPMLLLSRVTPGPDGKFSYTSIAPGQYTISARATQRPAGARGAGPGAEAVTGFVRVGASGGGAEPQIMFGPPGGSGPAYWANADVSVDGNNLSNVNLSLQPGMTLAGRVAFDGKKLAPPTDLTRVRLSMLPVQSGAGNVITVGALPSVTADASGAFSFQGVTPGRYQFQGSAPMAVGTGWVLKSVVVKGRDALNFPLEVGPGEEISDAVVTFTDVTQEVSGTLQDATGRPAPDYTIVVFPTDRRLWTSPVARRIRTTRPGTDGRFTVANLPAGEYRIAALTDIAPGEANDPAFLEQLVAASYAFTLADGEKRTQDLRIAGR